MIRTTAPSVAAAGSPNRFGLLSLCAGGLAAMLTDLPVMGQPGTGIRSVQVSPRPEIGASKPEGPAAELIGRLASESAEERRAAAQSLVAMGPVMEPQVRSARQQEEPALTFPFLNGEAPRAPWSAARSGLPLSRSHWPSR